MQNVRLAVGGQLVTLKQCWFPIVFLSLPNADLTVTEFSFLEALSFFSFHFPSLRILLSPNIPRKGFMSLCDPLCIFKIAHTPISSDLLQCCISKGQGLFWNNLEQGMGPALVTNRELIDKLKDPSKKKEKRVREIAE